MGLEISLMATVAAMVAWVVKVENAGLLNVLFELNTTSRVAGNTAPGYALSHDPSTAAMNFILKSALLRPLELPILESMPENLGGGQVGVEKAHAHPNREGAMLWIAVSVFLVIAIVVIALQIINCCACCCGKRDVSCLGLQLIRA